MNLGTIIRTARRSKDMTQEALASLLGVTLSAVSQWEMGKTMPDIALVPGICSALDLSADTLFSLDPASKEEQIEAVIAEAERMEDRGESPRAVLVLLEDALARFPDSMKLTGQTEIVTSIGKWRVQQNPVSCEVYDVDKIPMEYHIKQEDKIDKKGLLAHYKATGELIEGCEFKAETGIRFK